MESTGQSVSYCPTTRQRPRVVTCSLILYYLEIESRGSADRTTLRAFRSVEGPHQPHVGQRARGYTRTGS